MTTTTISSGVSSSGLTVSGGEYLEVQRGGAVTGTVVSSGGHLLEFGHDAGTVIEAGGHETIASAGIAYHPTVSSGGVLLDEGRILGGLTVDGGFAELASMQAKNIDGLTVTLSNSGIVELAGGSVVYDKVKFAGMGQKGDGIELVDWPAHPWGVRLGWKQTWATSGTLTLRVENSIKTYTLVGKFGASDFDLVGPNNGDVFIVDARATANFTQAAAAMPGHAADVAVHHGGSATSISTSPLAAVASSGR